MSVHVRKRARGRVVYEVVWRDPDRRQRCETFWTKREAEARDREIRDLRERGRHAAIDAGSESLAEATERWWVDHVESSVSQSTAMVYASALDGHLLPRLGSVPIRDLQPADVVALQRELRADGVGEAMTQKTLVVLSGIMRHSQLLWAHPRQPGGASADSTGPTQARDPPTPAAEDRAHARRRPSLEAGRARPPLSRCSPTPDCVRARRLRCGGTASAIVP